MSFAQLALICGVAVLGPILALQKWAHLPVVVGELAVGLVLGATGLQVLHASDPTFTFLGEVGFALVMFVAGAHVPLRSEGLRAGLRSGLLRAAAVGVLAVPAGLALAALFGTGHGMLYAVLLASSSASIVMPSLAGLPLTGPTIVSMLAQIAVADAMCIVLLPLAVDPDTPLGNSDFSGIVGYGPGNGCTGFLLDRGDFVEGSRHIVTAAHCQPAVGDVVTFFRRLPDGNLDKVQIPVIEVYVHPDWTGSVGAKQGDIAVAVLASVAPFGVADYALYSAAQATASTELGKVYVMAGVGTTGTGFSGQSNTEELQRVTITGNGGQFQIVVPPVPGSGQPARVTPPLAYNATAADITAAFNSIGLGVLVSSVSLGSLAPTATSRSYEILFRPGGAVNIPRLQFQQYAPDPLVLNGNLGTATFDTLIDGSIDPEYQRVAVNATGGNFTLSYGPTATAPIVYDPADPAGTALRIQTELEKLNLAGVGPGEVTVRPVTSGPNAGTFQVTFDQIGFDIPLLGANGAALVGGAGTVKVSPPRTLCRAIRCGRGRGTAARGCAASGCADSGPARRPRRPRPTAAPTRGWRRQSSRPGRWHACGCASSAAPVRAAPCSGSCR